MLPPYWKDLHPKFRSEARKRIENRMSEIDPRKRPQTLLDLSKMISRSPKLYAVFRKAYPRFRHNKEFNIPRWVSIQTHIENQRNTQSSTSSSKSTNSNVTINNDTIMINDALLLPSMPTELQVTGFMLEKSKLQTKFMRCKHTLEQIDPTRNLRLLTLDDIDFPFDDLNQMVLNARGIPPVVYNLIDRTEQIKDMYKQNKVLTCKNRALSDRVLNKMIQMRYKLIRVLMKFLITNMNI